MSKVKKRYYWIDILKILACFWVVVNHTGGYLLEYSGTNNLGIVIFYVINFIFCKMAVPIFIMVSGFLLLSKKSSYSEIRKRIIRIFIPLLFLSFLIFFKNNGFGINQIKNFFINFLEKPIIVSFWYLYMLIGLYLVTPFLQKMVKSFKLTDYKYFIIICLIIPSLLPVLSTYLPISFNYNFTLALFPICVGYYVSGLYLSKVPLDKKYRNLAIIFCLIFLVLFASSMIIPYVNSSKISYHLDTWNYITTVIPSLSLFYLIRYYFENCNFKSKTTKVISLFSSLTFGIYLLHTFINYKLYDFVLLQMLFELSPYIGIVMLEILTFICAGIITFVLKKLKFIKSFL